MRTAGRRHLAGTWGVAKVAPTCAAPMPAFSLLLACRERFQLGSMTPLRMAWRRSLLSSLRELQTHHSLCQLAPGAPSRPAASFSFAMGVTQQTHTAEQTSSWLPVPDAAVPAAGTQRRAT